MDRFFKIFLIQSIFEAEPNLPDACKKVYSKWVFFCHSFSSIQKVGFGHILPIRFLLACYQTEVTVLSDNLVRFF